VFQQLLQTVPGLEKRLMEDSSSEDVAHVAELVCALPISKYLH
jgi:hypothetical protein